MTTYYKLNLEQFHDNVPTGSQGVYKIYVLDNGKPIPIPRFLGVDEEGILYIGCSPKNTLSNRLADLIKALSPKYKSGNHIFGRKYKRLGEAFAAQYPFDNIAVTFEVSDSPGECERQQIDEYRSKFGEEPPFNSH